MTLYYFYIVLSPGGRVGFGIAANPKERVKQYTSHSGYIVKFPFVFGGQRTHAKALERTIKNQYADNIWVIEDWKTEWLNDDITVSQLYDYVSTLIKERHLKLKLVAQDFDITKELDVSV